MSTLCADRNRPRASILHLRLFPAAVAAWCGALLGLSVLAVPAHRLRNPLNDAAMDAATHAIAAGTCAVLAGIAGFALAGWLRSRHCAPTRNFGLPQPLLHPADQIGEEDDSPPIARAAPAPPDEPNAKFKALCKASQPDHPLAMAPLETLGPVELLERLALALSAHDCARPIFRAGALSRADASPCASAPAGTDAAHLPDNSESIDDPCGSLLSFQIGRSRRVRRDPIAFEPESEEPVTEDSGCPPDLNIPLPAESAQVAPAASQSESLQAVSPLPPLSPQVSPQGVRRHPFRHRFSATATLEGSSRG